MLGLNCRYFPGGFSEVQDHPEYVPGTNVRGLSFPRRTDTSSESTVRRLGRKRPVPVPHSPEFRERAVALARLGDKPIITLAQELGISRSCLRNWLAQANADKEGGTSGRLTTAEKAELAELRRKNKRLELENEILKRAAAYFARENVLPK